MKQDFVSQPMSDEDALNNKPPDVRPIEFATIEDAQKAADIMNAIVAKLQAASPEDKAKLLIVLEEISK